MRWFLDTEFHEDGQIIELISIALVSETGEAYYAVSNWWRPDVCNDFVKEHVIPKLPPREEWKQKTQIANEVKDLLLRDGKPEIWGYFADYDWIALCQLYGRMVDLPKGFPFWCCDLKQLMQERGFEKTDLPAQAPETEHSALGDAMWIREAYLHIVGGGK